MDRQVVYESYSKSKFTMADLLRNIKKSLPKEAGLINITSYLNSFIVTFIRPVKELSHYAMEGWNVKRNTNIKPFLERPSLSNEWYNLLLKD